MEIIRNKAGKRLPTPQTYSTDPPYTVVFQRFDGDIDEVRCKTRMEVDIEIKNLNCIWYEVYAWMKLEIPRQYTGLK